MAETQKNPNKLGKCSFVFGIIAVIFALLPYLSTWFLIISWLSYLFGIIGLILGVIAAVKKQKKAITGIILCIVACVGYYFIVNSEYIVEQAAKDATEAIGGMFKLAKDLSE